MKLEIVVVVLHLNLTAPDSAAVLPDEHGMMVMVYLMFLAHVKTSKHRRPRCMLCAGDNRISLSVCSIH